MAATELTSIEVLSSTQTLEWNALLDGLPDKDIYFSNEYCRLFEVEGREWAELFVYRQGEQFVVYPYMRRSISHLPAIAAMELPDEWFDISTPYGYGGPLTNVASGEARKALLDAFASAFAAFCRERRILTEFVRFHPMIGNAKDYLAVNPQLNRHTAYMDLRSQTEAGLIQHYCRNHKTNVRKFSSSPLTVRRSNPLERLEPFTELYYGTLNDLQADAFYYFPKSFIEGTCRLLEGRVKLFEVMHDGVAIAACLVMHEFPRMHYHLSGWNRAYLPWAPTKLLIHAAALWGIEEGFEQFHLGGGYKGDDRLYDFKHGFATNLPPLDYYLGQRVFDPELYARIRLELEPQGHADFFPLYRDPTLTLPNND